MKILFKYQFWHLLSLLFLLFGIQQLVLNDVLILKGNYWNVSTKNWFLMALAIPIVHQVYVLLCWRLELYFKTLTSQLGKHAFLVYKSIFFVIFVSRFVLVVIVALSNKKTLLIDAILKYSLIGFMTLLAVYAFYSVLTYFGFDRAAGLDHFDSNISKKPFVNQGIFKYTNNGMYKFAFMVFYIPGLIYESKGAILVAIFSHLYIWVHYYFTELPDIKMIYQSKEN